MNISSSHNIMTQQSKNYIVFIILHNFHAFYSLGDPFLL